MIQLKHRFNFNILIMITISLGVLMRSFWYLKALFCKEIQELHPGSDIRYPKPQMHGGPPQVFLGLSYSFPRWWCHLRLPPGILSSECPTHWQPPSGFPTSVSSKSFQHGTLDFPAPTVLVPASPSCYPSVFLLSVNGPTQFLSPKPRPYLWPFSYLLLNPLVSSGQYDSNGSFDSVHFPLPWAMLPSPHWSDSSPPCLLQLPRILTCGWPACTRMDKGKQRYSEATPALSHESWTFWDLA